MIKRGLEVKYTTAGLPLQSCNSNSLGSNLALSINLEAKYLSRKFLDTYSDDYRNHTLPPGNQSEPENVEFIYISFNLIEIMIRVCVLILVRLYI